MLANADEVQIVNELDGFQEGVGAVLIMPSRVCNEAAIELKFDRNVRAHDGRPFAGFAIAGEDRHFYPATAEFVVTGKDDRGRDQRDESRLRVSHPLVPNPVSVRYAWARNPVANAVNSRHHERTIPIVSFRTDDWDWPEAPFRTADSDAEQKHRQAIHVLRQAARKQSQVRRLLEAKFVIDHASAEAE